MSIGANIHDLRKSKNMTQTELADILGVTVQSVSKWENDICSPDVSLFPLIATVFGCSIDRLFGVSSDFYKNEIDEILSELKEKTTIEEEIALLEPAVNKYSNNNVLKLKLANSYFQKFRISDDISEREENANLSKALCNKILCSETDKDMLDCVNELFVRIYSETGEFDMALRAFDRLSARLSLNKLYLKAQIYYDSKQFDKLRAFSEQTLFDCFSTMIIINSMCFNAIKDDTEKIDFCNFQHRLLSVFDGESDGFYSGQKMINSFQKAVLLKRIGEKEKCLDELSTMFEYAQQTLEYENKDHRISSRCKLLKHANGYEAYLDKNSVMTYIDKLVSRHFDALFADNEKYLTLKREFVE